MCFPFQGFLKREREGETFLQKSFPLAFLRLEIGALPQAPLKVLFWKKAP
jgi:hypothetical protein